MKFGKIGKVVLMLIPVLLLVTFTAYASSLTWTEYGPISDFITVYGDLMQEGPGGRTWMMYTQTSAGQFFIGYRTSDDGGQTWSAQVNLTDDSHFAWFHGHGSIIKAGNGSIYLIYINGDRDIVLRRLVDFATNNWTAPTIVYDGNATIGTCHSDACVLKDGTIMVVFHEKMNAARTSLRLGEDIWGIKSSDNGQTWSAPFLVFTDGPEYDISDQLPSIAQSCDGTIHVVFSMSVPLNKLLWTISPDNGTSWMVQGEIALAGAINVHVRKTVDGGLALVYGAQRAGDLAPNVYIKFYDQGVWTPEERVTNKTSGTVLADLRPYVIQMDDPPTGLNHKKMLVAYRINVVDATTVKKVYYSWSSETVSVEHAVSRTLTITTTTNGTTDPSPGVYGFPNGTLATVEAVPDSGFVLDHWELNGSNVGATNPISITMNASYTLYAVFSRPPQTATLSLVTLYEVSLELVWPVEGYHVLVLFHSYGGVYEGNVTVWSGTPPAYVILSMNVLHPLGWPVENATLVVTNDAGTILETITTFLVRRSDLMSRITELDTLWALGYPRPPIFLELIDIDTQWSYAPS